MLYRTIGGRRTVSALCLGTMNFGTSTDPDTATTILDRFVEAGGTFVDTANNYGQWGGDAGRSEELLGHWMSSRGTRDQLVIVNYLIGTVFLSMLTTPYLVNGHYAYIWGLYPKAGVLHPLFLVYFFGVSGLALLSSRTVGRQVALGGRA